MEQVPRQITMVHRGSGVGTPPGVRAAGRGEGGDVWGVRGGLLHTSILILVLHRRLPCVRKLYALFQFFECNSVIIM